MRSPTVVFLRNGLVSLLAALAIWLLPFLLRDDPAKRQWLATNDQRSEDSDIFQELDAAFLPEKAVKPKLRPEPVAGPLPKPEAKAGRQPETERAATPLTSVGKTLPTPAQARAETRPVPVTETLEERIRKATLNDISLARLAPAPAPTQPPAQTAVLTLRSEPQPYTPSATAIPAAIPPAPSLSPPLPERHPHRLSFADEIAGEDQPRTIQAAIQQAQGESRVATSVSANTPLSFLSNFLRRREPVAAPAAASPQPHSVASFYAGPAALIPNAQLAATPVQPVRPPAPKWAPTSCDDRDQFWK